MLNDWKSKLKQAWNENPLGTLAVGALVATAASKLIGAVNDTRNSKTWAKEVDRRRMK